MVVKASNEALKNDSRDSLDGAVLFWMHQANQALRAELLRRFREHGHAIGSGQWEVLTRLWQRDGASQSALAAATGRDKAGMTRLLDRMARDGLVFRQADPADRRVSRVHLTEDGRNLHEQLLPIVSQAITTALDGLDDADKSVLRKSLKRIHANLSEPTGG